MMDEHANPEEEIAFPEEFQEELVSLPLPAAPTQPQKKLVFAKHPPIVSYTILGITVLVYLLQMGSEILLGYDLVAMYGMKSNIMITAGEYWRLITPILLHANMLHIGFNMYGLYLYGPEMERVMGHWQFLALYLVSGFTGVAASFALTDANSLGASTSVVGLLAAFGMMAYLNQEAFGENARRVVQGVLRIGFINLLIGLSSPGIDNWGHLGGLLGGVMIIWVGGPVFKVRETDSEVHIENQRGNMQFVLGLGLTLLVFGAITVVKMLLGN